MFDLAIKTTLESNPSRPTHSPLAFCADSSSLRELGFAIFASFGKEFPNFALLIIRVDLLFQEEIKFLIFLREFCSLRNLRDPETKVFVLQLDDSIVKLWRST
ncbi:hypothetical protein GQ457_02G027050 [Hibiscus cannabinus]